MMTGDDEASQDSERIPGSLDPVEPVHSDDSYPNPIVVHAGGGAYLRMPISRKAVEQLGGAARLRERLTRIMESEASVSGSVTEDTVADLTARYDHFLAQIESADPDYNPIRVDPTGGWELTIVVPQGVLEGLGGHHELHQRVTSFTRTELHLGPTESGINSDSALAAHYDNFLGQVELIMRRREA